MKDRLIENFVNHIEAKGFSIQDELITHKPTKRKNARYTHKDGVTLLEIDFTSKTLTISYQNSILMYKNSGCFQLNVFDAVYSGLPINQVPPEAAKPGIKIVK